MLKRILLCVSCILIITGTACNTEVKEEEAPVSEITQEPATAAPSPSVETPAPTPAPIDYEAVRPYEVGQIMVLMYHGIEKEVAPNDYYQRTVEDFKNDLLELYNRGFRVISLKDLINNNITTEAGYTPVVITFDDGRPSSFSLASENGRLVPTPDCGLDILMKFNEQYPDFGMAATFFINGNNDPFKGAGTQKERFEYLIANGCDIGNHTYSHPYLNKLNAEQIMEEVGKVDEMIKAALPDYMPVGVAYPFGIRPEEELRGLVLDGTYNGKAYHYDFALREGMSEASNIPNRNGYDVLNLPRARGSDTEGETTDLWGRLRFYEENPEYRYISDGNPDRIAVPKQYEDNVNKESLGGKELYIY